MDFTEVAVEVRLLVEAVMTEATDVISSVLVNAHVHVQLMYRNNNSSNQNTYVYIRVHVEGFYFLYVL